MAKCIQCMGPGGQAKLGGLCKRCAPIRRAMRWLGR
jgi:hypothetical protein